MVKASKSTRTTATKPASRARGPMTGAKRAPTVAATAQPVEAPTEPTAPPKVERSASGAAVAAVPTPSTEVLGGNSVSATKSAGPEPARDEAEVARPAPDAVVSQPSKQLADARKPGAAEAVASEPTGSKSAALEPAVAKPTDMKPVTPEPELAKPAAIAAPEPATEKPAATKPAAPEPTVTKPVATRPAAPEAAVAKPPQSEPAAAGVSLFQGITVRYWQEQLERTMTAGRAMMLCRSPEEAVRLQLGYFQGSLVSGIDRIGDVARWSQATLRETLLPRSR